MEYLGLPSGHNVIIEFIKGKEGDRRVREGDVRIEYLRKEDRERKRKREIVRCYPAGFEDGGKY